MIGVVAMECELKLMYGFSGKNNLEIEEDNFEHSSLARDITPQQALNLARIFAKRYGFVRLYDGVHEAYIDVKNNVDDVQVHTYYEEEQTDVEKKYGLYVEVEKYDETDLDKEKWDNYWGDYNQCGIKIDWR